MSVTLLIHVAVRSICQVRYFVAEILFRTELTDHTTPTPLHGVVNPDPVDHTNTGYPPQNWVLSFEKTGCKNKIHSDLSDQYVFGSPGSGSASQRYGSGSFYHQEKKIRTLIPNVFWLLFDFLSLKNVNVPSKKISRKNFFLLVCFCLRLEGQWRK
jgi:hypothetical protein